MLTAQQASFSNLNSGQVGTGSPLGLTEQSLDPHTIIPSLSQHLHDAFGGPHTQFACSCFYGHQNGSLVPCQIIVSCTQLFLCDAESFVIRVAMLSKLLAIYHRDVVPQGQQGPTVTEQELLLVFDREHDLLLRGHLTCDGTPPKPLLQTLLALQKVHCPTAPVALHMNSTVPLKDVAKLKPPQGYVAPLPHRDETWEQCPCWRAADVLSITDEEFAMRLRNMCIVYCPEKLPQVPELCRKYSRKKGGVLQHLVQQYGPEPTEEHAMAVYKVLQREEKFSDILRSSSTVLPTRKNGGQINTQEFMGNNANQNQSAIPLSTLFGAKKKLKDQLIPQNQHLYYPVLRLTNQPSGGYGRLHVKVTPVPYLNVQHDSVAKFCRRPKDPEHEFWYMTNEGHVLPFDISQEVMLPFGYEHGDRVLATWGVTRGRWSTVIGVRDGTLWVQDDGDTGACALVGFTCRDELERCNGWIKHERISASLRETHVIEILTLPEMTPRAIFINPEIVYKRFGFCHGEVVRCCEPCTNPFDGVAVIAGVDAEDETSLFAYFVDPSDEGMTQEIIFAQQLRLQLKQKQAQLENRAAANNANPQATIKRSSGVPGIEELTAAPLGVDSDMLQAPVVDGGAATIVGSSRRINPSRAAAQQLVRCLSPDDVFRAYGWKSVGTARILQHQQSSGSSLSNPAAVIL